MRHGSDKTLQVGYANHFYRSAHKFEQICRHRLRRQNVGYSNFSQPQSHLSFFFFFFNDTATTEIYTLSLHDALPNSPLQPNRCLNSRATYLTAWTASFSIVPRSPKSAIFHPTAASLTSKIHGNSNIRKWRVLKCLEIA